MTSTPAEQPHHDGSPGSITFQTAAVNAGDAVPVVTISVVAGGLPPRELCG